MAGTVPVSGKLSIQDLAATLTRREQLDFEQVTALTVDPTQVRNLVTTVEQQDQLGALVICAAGADQEGTRILSTTAYILGVQTEIDLYRLPIPDIPDEVETLP
jgi:hypothetical protein